jgi:ABC-type arginine/histidine transport system permease subunit
MIIATIGAVGLVFCIFVMPFTQYAKDRINNRFDFTMMYIYVGFLIMAILGFMLQI